MEKHYTTAEVAELLSTSPRSVVRMIEAGRLPGSFALPFGAKRKSWRIPQSALEQLQQCGQPQEKTTRKKRVVVRDYIGEYRRRKGKPDPLTD